MKYKFNAFVAPILMLFVYLNINFIVNDGFGCGIDYCSKVPLINYGRIFGTEIFNIVVVFILKIIPGIIILLALIDFFLGLKTTILNYKFKNTGNQEYVSRSEKTISAINYNNRVLFVFFIIVLTFKISLLLEKNNPRPRPLYNEYINCPPSGAYFNPSTATFESC